MELNPNHPTTSTMHDHWHKLAAILVNRCPGARTLVTLDEIERMEGLAITLKEVGGGIELRIVTMEEGERLARQEGGLPA
jgi:hypothetical protein